jgi:hypothetical protein
VLAQYAFIETYTRYWTKYTENLEFIVVTIPKRESASIEGAHRSETPDLDRNSGTVRVSEPWETPLMRLPSRVDDTGALIDTPRSVHSQLVPENDPFAEALGESTKAYAPSEFERLIRSTYREESGKALSELSGNRDLNYDLSVHEQPTIRPPT